jgi:hypothetical protein
MAVVFKQDTPDRLDIEQREDFTIQSILFLPLVAVLFFLVVFLIDAWLFTINSPLGNVCLVPSGLLVLLIGFSIFDFVRSMAKDLRSDPQSITIDLKSGLATGILKDFGTKERQPWKLALDKVDSIDLMIDNPMHDLWTLDLKVSDGSSVRLLYVGRADSLQIAQKIQALLHKPIKDSNDWKP